MKIIIQPHDMPCSVDRDGTIGDYGREGFDVAIGGITIHFEDENDAVQMASAILQRMGLMEEIGDSQPVA